MSALAGHLGFPQGRESKSRAGSLAKAWGGGLAKPRGLPESSGLPKQAW